MAEEEGNFIKRGWASILSKGRERGAKAKEWAQNNLHFPGSKKGVMSDEYNAAQQKAKEDAEQEQVTQEAKTAAAPDQSQQDQTQKGIKNGSVTAADGAAQRQEAQQQQAAAVQQTQSQPAAKQKLLGGFNSIFGTRDNKNLKKELDDMKAEVMARDDLTDEQKQQMIEQRAREIGASYEGKDVRSGSQRLKDTWSAVKEAASPLAEPIQNALAEGAGAAIGNAFKQQNNDTAEKAAGSGNRETKANIADEQGAANMVTAQQNQQIANRNEFAEADKKDMAKAGAEATKAVNQLGAEAGSGAAALAGAKAAASTGGPDITAEQRRSDQARQAASEARNQGFENKKTAETIRETNEAINDNLRRTNERNQQATQLSNAYQGMNGLVGQLGNAIKGGASGIYNAFKSNSDKEMAQQRKEQEDATKTPAEKNNLDTQETAPGSGSEPPEGSDQNPQELGNTPIQPKEEEEPPASGASGASGADASGAGASGAGASGAGAQGEGEEEAGGGQQVENSDAAVAKAKVGDWLIRKNGQKVVLTQKDIDLAKAKVGGQ